MKKTFVFVLILCTALVLPLALTACSGGGEDVKYAEIKVRDYGSIIVKLDRSAAPITVDNFVKLAKEGFYDGLTFHRFVKDFVIQGGDPRGDGTGSSPDTIKGEFSENGVNNPIKHKRGTISMARSMSYNSASSQFFICVATSDGVSYSLDGKYAAFGEVVSGMEFVDRMMANVGDLPGAAYALDKENQPVMESVRIYDTYPG